MSDERRLRARARALRAARVVTLASALVSCSGREGAPDDDAGLDAAVVDASSGDAGASDASTVHDGSTVHDASASVDAGFDAAAEDAGLDDAGPDDGGTDAAIADAGFDAAGCTDFPPTTPECCAAADGFWEDDRCIVAVPGPFVPPRMA